MAAEDTCDLGIKSFCSNSLNLSGNLLTIGVIIDLLLIVLPLIGSVEYDNLG